MWNAFRSHLHDILVSILFKLTLFIVIYFRSFIRLPCISGEKVSMGLTCFVAYSVFMLMVAEKVPATSETVPIISNLKK